METKKLKVLMTSENYLPTFGGGEIHVFNLIKQLRLNNFEVVLVTNEAKKYNDDPQVIRIPWSRKSVLKLFSILWRESKDADIIHCHYSYRLAVLGSIVARLRGIPSFVVLHGLGTLDIPHSALIYQVAHSTYRYLSLKLSTHIIATSEDMAKIVYKYVRREKITNILNGFDISIFNKNVIPASELVEKYKDKKIVTSVRRLVQKNGIHYLVEAIPFVIEKIPNIKYIMIGGGRMKDEIVTRINSLRISDYVDVIGDLENFKIPEYVKLSDVVVFPSTAESSSIACAEVMAVGVPIVASRVGGLIELLGKNEERGTLVKLVDWEESNYDAPNTLPEDRYKALAEAIVDNILNKNEDKVKKAIEYAENNLCWEAVTKKTLDLYKRFLN